jgi:lysozyme family protein
MSRFDDVLKVTLGFEGGYSNDKNDRGGETNLGITAGTLARAHKAGIVPHADVKVLTRSEAAAIYKAFYWDAIGAGKMPEPLDLILFDACVNHGPGGAGKLLQEALNALLSGNPLAVDGAIGPKTWAALDAVLEADEGVTRALPTLEPHALLRYLCVDCLMNRAEMFDGIADRNASQRGFLRGWIHQRVVKLGEKAGLEG